MLVVEGGVPAPTLPELVTVDCPECDGVGYHEYVTPLGVDHSTRCTTCYGACKLEVCSGCRTVPTVKNGVDFCGCTQHPDVVWAKTFTKRIEKAA